MPDVPGNSSTTASLTVGSTTGGVLEVVGDHDWYRITLNAGQAISVTIDGVTLEDPYLYIRNASGNLLYENDDISAGVNRDSQLAFSATYSGVYYIDVGAFDEAYAGSYQINVATWTPPPLATYDQIANQLVNGDGGPARFNVTQGGSISVNLTGLTAAGQTLAQEALALWSDIIGVSFQPVATGGQIVFDDNEEGAFAEASGSGGFITSAHVNVSTQWLADYGTHLSSYSFQTYIHEVGHALGLSHAGSYNETARYPYDALFRNDSWAVSVMSYFTQTENSYFADLGFDENHVVTPMIADILAMSMLYGLSTTTRLGNTTYNTGWHTNMGALCIFDSGGIDTIDCSSFGGDHLINLNPGTFSNIMGEKGNVSIALGVVIENAIGASGHDTLIGNGADNVLNGNYGNDSIDGGGGADTLTGALGTDTLTGGAGTDTFRDAAEGLNGDTISDFGAGDKIVITNANLAGFSFSLSGSTLTYTGGSLTFGAAFSGNISASAAAGGGVQLTIGPANLVLTGGSGNDTLTGGAGDDSINGGGGIDTMIGGAGDDTYIVDRPGDVATEGAGAGTDLVQSSVTFTLGANVENLTLTGGGAINGTGNALANILTGNGAANILNGGAAGDTMIGGLGNDTYVVDHGGDAVTEGAGAGTDTVQSSISYTLGANVERLTLTGVAVINGNGNTLANILVGNSSTNILNGGAAADTMIGGLGNDTYVVDNASDVATEAAAAGTDIVRSSISFALGSNLENLTLTGAAAINGTGNALANILTGNTAANILNGGGGIDTMIGGKGNDTYVVNHAGDIVTESFGAGIDLVQSSATFTLGANVENLALTGGGAIKGTGNTLANILTGNGAANVLSGLAGNDQLNGGLGNDNLFGGAGHDDLDGGAGLDAFRFDTALNAATNVDDILDFSVIDDTIFLDRDIFTGIAANGTLAASAFVNGTIAGDANDRVIYDAATGDIFYDADGNAAGAQILFATVLVGTALTNADFAGYI